MPERGDATALYAAADGDDVLSLGAGLGALALAGAGDRLDCLGRAELDAPTLAATSAAFVRSEVIAASCSATAERISGFGRWRMSYRPPRSRRRFP